MPRRSVSALQYLSPMKRILSALVLVLSLPALGTECATLASFAGLPPMSHEKCEAPVKAKETILRADGLTAAAMETVPPLVEIPTAMEVASGCHASYADCVRARGAKDTSCAALRDLCLFP